MCAFTEEFAGDNPATVKSVLKALNDASLWLDEPANRPDAAHMISPAALRQLPGRSIIGRACGGHYEFGDGRKKDYGDGGDDLQPPQLNYPRLKYVTWWLTQFRRWGMLDARARLRDAGATRLAVRPVRAAP